MSNMEIAREILKHPHAAKCDKQMARKFRKSRKRVAKMALTNSLRRLGPAGWWLHQ